jgi:hypothetical protein
MLEARRLVKRFHGVTVVDDVSFVVRPEPSGNLKTAGSIYVAAFLVIAFGLAWIERGVLIFLY